MENLVFVLVLLTDEDNGFIINSMHSSREGCFTYAKEVVNGEAFVILSEEEQRHSRGKIKYRSQFSDLKY